MDARCPRCSSVFTTDRSGIQFCPNCGQQVDVPEPPRAAGAGWGQGPGPGPGGSSGGGRFTGEPPPGGSPIPGHRELTPWERRKEVGVIKGLFETWKLSVFSPKRFFPTVRPDVPWTEALFYAWILHALTVGASLPFIGLGTFHPVLPPELADQVQVSEALRAMSGAVGIGQALVSLVLYPVFLLIGSAIYHVVAMLFGAAQNGFGATVRAFCYSLGPNVLGLSVYVFFSLGLCITVGALVWESVLLVLALANLQNTTIGKATGIVVLPDVLVCCCCGAGFAALAAGMAGMMGAGSRSI
jgi:hypothetical protein